MTERSDQPQKPPAANEPPEVYSISQDKDGSFHISRRGFLAFGAAIGGTLLVRGVCPRFGTQSTPSKPGQAGMTPLTRVYLHTGPRIDSSIIDTLQQNDFVRLINDHPDLGWVEVATQSDQQGWVKRSLIDFSRAIKSSSRNFGLRSALTPTPTQTDPHLTCSVQLSGGDNMPNEVLAAGQDQYFSEVIQNGDFEAGGIHWVEESSGTIIRNDWSDPYQGSWVAWLGGPDADERLTQLFHMPADVQDAQTLKFYLKVTTDETGATVDDVFRLRFLDAVGNPISSDTHIRDNTSPTDWVQVSVSLTGMTGFADQNIQVQFECITDSSLDTYFVLDLVSLNLICGALYYVYLPVVMREPPPTPTPGCPSDCTSDCPSDGCSSDCGYDCGYDCPIDCPVDCIVDCPIDCPIDYICPVDCIVDCYHCGYDCSYDCPVDCIVYCPVDFIW